MKAIDLNETLPFVKAEPDLAAILMQRFSVLTDKEYPEITAAQAAELVEKYPEISANDLIQLYRLSLSHLPTLTCREVHQLTRAFHGIDFSVSQPPCDANLLSITAEGFIEAPEAETLRREMEDGYEPAQMDAFRQLPEVQFAHGLEELNPKQASSLLIAIVRFLESCRVNQSADPDFERFFVLREDELGEQTKSD